MNIPRFADPEDPAQDVVIYVTQDMTAFLNDDDELVEEEIPDSFTVADTSGERDDVEHVTREQAMEIAGRRATEYRADGWIVEIIEF